MASGPRGLFFFGNLVLGCGTWVWLKSKELGQTAGFSLWFHLPGCRFGYLFLTHSHLAWGNPLFFLVRTPPLFANYWVFPLNVKLLAGDQKATEVSCRNARFFPNFVGFWEDPLRGKQAGWICFDTPSAEVHFLGTSVRLFCFELGFRKTPCFCWGSPCWSE